MSFEVITTYDKGQRDRLYEDLRRNGNEQEKQVVKFSSVERLPEDRVIQYGTRERIAVFFKSGKGTLLGPVHQIRQVFRSTWSVAFPSDVNSLPRKTN